MIPANTHDFMIACVGASASFIGLLFVGLSVVLQKVGDQKVANTDRILAESAYAGLIDIFFVSLVGTIANESIGYVNLIMALVGLLSCWRLRNLSQLAPLITSALVYLLQLGLGVSILMHPEKLVNIGVFETVIISLFSISLVRAWGLTGLGIGDQQKDQEK